MYRSPSFRNRVPHIDPTVGTVDVVVANTTRVALPAEVAFVAMRVTGSVTENSLVTLSAQAVTERNIQQVAASGPPTLTLQRGAVSNVWSAAG